MARQLPSAESSAGPGPAGAAASPTRRRLLRRILAPIGGVLVIALSLAGILWHADRANRAGALALTEEVLASLEGRVAEQVRGFLGSAERAVRLLRELHAAPAEAGPERQTLQAAALQILRQTPQVSLVMAADPDGNYLAFRRGSDGGFSALLIRNSPGPRSLTTLLFDPAGRPAGERPQEETAFDPRSRPWYQAALAGAEAAWTEIYVFFTDRVPGITVAAALRDPVSAEVRGVVALDVSLDALSAFLRGLQVGQSGRAVLVDGAGRIVAHPDAAAALEEGPEGLKMRRLDAIGDPVLARAYDLLRIEGDVRRVEVVEGRRWVVLVSGLPQVAAEGWRVIAVAPEDDFTGFVAANSNEAALLSAGVVVLALVFALLFAREGLAVDQAAREVAARRASLAAQSAAFEELAGSAALFDPAAPLPPEFTERLCAVAQGSRAVVWRLSSDRRTLALEDSYEAERRGHTRDAALLREEMPAFFRRLGTGEPLLVADAARERTTAELHRIWLSPLGSRALAAMPIRRGGELLGVVWVEDPAETDEEVLAFLSAVAKLLAVRLSGGATALAEAVAEEARAAPPEPEASDAALAGPALAADLSAEVAADVYPAAAVVVIRFTDPLALAGRRAAAIQGALVERLAAALEQAGREAGIPYLRLMGDELVAAAGLSAEESGAQAARRMAAFALEARARCLALFEEAEAEPAFRIGLDLGVAIGSRVGSGEGFLNLWGDAVRMAGQMAASAPEGGIQATEAVRAALSAQYLFRPRGRFYLPRHGTAESFILAAAL